jgi:hypothetical protein
MENEEEEEEEELYVCELITERDLKEYSLNNLIGLPKIYPKYLNSSYTFGLSKMLKRFFK